MKKIKVVVVVGATILVAAIAVGLLGLLSRQGKMNLASFEKGAEGITNAIGRAPSPFAW